MNKIAIAISCLFLITGINSFAQSQTLSPAVSSYIEVTGNAEEEVVPDEIFISITLKERYVNKDKITIETQEAQMKNALKSIGVDLKNLYLSDVNSDYVKIRRQKKDMLTKKEYVLKVATATMVGQVFQELDKMDITDGFISKVNHSKIDSLKKEIRIKAIKSAKEKATYLLAALGEQVGKVIVVTDSPDPGTQPYYPMPRVMAMVAADGIPEAKEEIEFQKIKLTSSIFVKFAVK
ncbi:MAG: SIMPL domain-containing protein [Bacteroidota bacterium]